MAKLTQQKITRNKEDEKLQAKLWVDILLNRLQPDFANRDELVLYLEDTAATIREELAIESGIIVPAEPGSLSEGIFENLSEEENEGGSE